MGDSLSHLPAWTGAPRDSDVPSVYEPTLASGYLLRIVPVYNAGVEIEGTVDYIQIVDEAGNPVVNFGDPGDVIAAVHQLPTRDQLRYLMAHAEFLAWVRQAGYYSNTSIKYDGTNENLQSLGPFEIVSANGQQLTIDSGAYDFRHLALANQAGVIGPLDQVEFASNVVLSNQVTACVKRVVSYGSGTGTNVTLELFQNVDIATTTDDGLTPYCFIKYEYNPAPWPFVRDLFPLYGYWERRLVSYATAEAGLIELTRSHDGSQGRIAHPRVETDEGGGEYKEATVEVLKVASDGLTKTDITASTLSRWNSTISSGSPVSTFDGSGLLASGEQLMLRWRMERNEAIPHHVCDVVGSDRCLYAQRDASDTRDFCAKARQGTAPSGLSDFIAACYQWDCDGYAADQPFDFADLDDWLAKMWLSVPFAEKQATPAGVTPVVYNLYRHGVASLRHLLGGPPPTANSDGQTDISHPTTGVWGDGAFYDANARASSAPVSTGELTGLASDGSNGSTAYDGTWGSTNDTTRGHRSLLRTDRLRTLKINQTADSFQGRSVGDRCRIIPGHIVAATLCEHNEDDAETNHSGQCTFRSNADGSATLTIGQLGGRGNRTITTGEVAAASYYSPSQIYIEPANKQITINWLDTSSSPPFANSGTINIGAAGLGVVRGHEACQIWDADSGIGIGGTALAGAQPGDWIQFSGVSGGDASAIEATAYLVDRCEDFGGGSEDLNFNGSPGDPPSDWDVHADFLTLIKKRSRIYLRDHNGLLVGNAANLIGANITVISGGIVADINEVRNNDDVIDSGDYEVDPFAGTITIDSSVDLADGYYRIDCDIIDTRAAPQGAVFREIVEAMVALETVEIEVPLEGQSISISIDAERRHPELWQESDAEMDVSEVDFAADFMATKPSTYYTTNERFYRTGEALAHSGSTTYKNCPIAGESPTVYKVDDDDWLVNTSIQSIGAAPKTILRTTGGAFAGDFIATRQYRQECYRLIRAPVALPGGILRGLPQGATILEATIDLTIDSISELYNEASRVGSADTTTNSNPSGTRTNYSSAVGMELIAVLVDKTVISLGGVGGISFDTTSGSDTQTVDITSIFQRYLDTYRGQVAIEAVYCVPAVSDLLEWDSFHVPGRTGTKAAEYTGCAVGPSPPYEVATAQSTAVLDDNEYTDRSYELEIDGWSVTNCVLRAAMPDDLRDLRLMRNALGYRDLVNP